MTHNSPPPRETIGLVTLPEELIVALNVNDRFITKMSCSPFEQKELVLGWLYAQGIIEKRSEIVRMEIEDGIAKMRVWLDGEYLDRFAAISPSQSSSCGGGSFNTRLFGTMPPLCRIYDLDLERLKRLARAMIDRAKNYKVHGGVHCALLAEHQSGRILVSREDIGRNNAIDKVVGWGLEEGVDFAGILLLVTGRVSSDMILKCYRAGISTMVSLTTATSLAFDIALRTDLTLICHVLKPKPILINF